LAACLWFPPAGVSTAQIPQALEPLPGRYSPQTEEALASLKKAVDLASRSEFARAADALPDQRLPADFLLADYYHLERGRACLAAKRLDEAVRSFRAVRSAPGGSPLLKEAILGECEALIALKEAPAALALLDGCALPSDAALLFQRGLVLEAAGNRSGAVSAYLGVYTDFASSAEDEPARSKLLAISGGILSRPEHLASLLRRAENLLEAGSAREAHTLLQRLAGVRADVARDAQRRRVLLAEAEHRLGRSTRALSLLRTVSADDAETGARAAYLRAACNRSLGREAAFLESRDLALRLYPKSRWTESALHSVATYWETENRLDRVEEAHAALAAHFPGGRYAERASWKSAICAFARDDPSEALSRFARHLQIHRHPEAAAAAGYWMGRCCERLGDAAGALLFYERSRALAGPSYYGQRCAEAAARLAGAVSGIRSALPGIDLASALRALEAVRLSPVVVAAPSSPALASIERARQLLSAPLRDLALSELRQALRRFPGEKALAYFTARVFENSGDPLSMITTLRRAFPHYAFLPPGSLPDEVREMFFPTHFLDLVQVHAASNGVDPAVVLGIIRQESAFVENARSRANARGLMQIIPSTGRMLARQSGLRGYSHAKLYQAGTNIALGTRHFSTLLAKFDGKLELALAGYNAGDQRALRWRAAYGDTDLAMFAELVPFAETRQYIKQVLTNSAHYRELLAPPPGGGSR
jgi:soluble lytic murein transglycosylase